MPFLWKCLHHREKTVDPLRRGQDGLSLRIYLDPSFGHAQGRTWRLLRVIAPFVNSRRTNWQE